MATIQKPVTKFKMCSIQMKLKPPEIRCRICQKRETKRHSLSGFAFVNCDW